MISSWIEYLTVRSILMFINIKKAFLHPFESAHHSTLNRPIFLPHSSVLIIYPSTPRRVRCWLIHVILCHIEFGCCVPSCFIDEANFPFVRSSQPRSWLVEQAKNVLDMKDARRSIIVPLEVCRKQLKSSPGSFLNSGRKLEIRWKQKLPIFPSTIDCILWQPGK